MGEIGTMVATKNDSEYFKKLIGHRIRFLRDKAGISQMELAYQVGYESTGAISQIERGLRGMDKEKLFRCADVLGVHPAVLMSPKKFTEEQLTIIVNLLKVIENNPQSPHLYTINQLLELAAKE